VLSDQGRFEEAEPLLRESMRMWKAAGDRYSLGNCLSQLARVASRSGRFVEALGLFEEAREAFFHVGAQGDVIDIDAKVAECRVFMADGNVALGLASEVLSRVAADGAAFAAPLLERVRGCALAQTGDAEGARNALEESLSAARARGADYEVAIDFAEKARKYARDAKAKAMAAKAEGAPPNAGPGTVKLPAASEKAEN